MLRFITNHLEKIEYLILAISPIAGIIAVILDFTTINFLLLLILLVLWKHANGAL